MSNRLLDRIISWARAEDNVVALIATGSLARGVEAVDEYSDYDLEIIAKDLHELAADDKWLRGFGNVWVMQYLDKGQPYPTRLVYYENAVKVDFTLADKGRLKAMKQQGKLDDLYERGYRVLLDKADVAKGLPVPSGRGPVVARPSQEEFAGVVSEFWFEAAHIPKYLMRDDLWVVKFRDWTMKEMLLKMLEWHSLGRNGEASDVWHIGSKMRTWVDERTWSELHGVFGRFDTKDSWRSLLETTALFQRLSQETASKLGFTHNGSIERDIRGYILDQAKKYSPL